MTAVNILTPTGRLVAGSLYEPQTKDQSGAPLVIKTGPDAGKATQKFYFGLAIPKTQAAWWDEPWGKEILAVGQAGFPQGQWKLPSFAWKIVDGDSQVPNKMNRKPCDNEGYPGNWVLNFSSSFAPKVYNSDGSAIIADEGAVKLGYYIQVAGSVDANNNLQNPGVYLNHRMVALQGYGPEITRGPDPTSVGFGKGPAPAGMLATPPGAMHNAPAVPGSPMVPGPGVPDMPPVATPPPAPVAVTPHPAFLSPPPAIPGVGAPPPPPAAPAPPPPPPAGPQMTAKAAGQPYAEFIKAGWTDANLRAHGYMV